MHTLAQLPLTRRFALLPDAFFTRQMPTPLLDLIRRSSLFWLNFSPATACLQIASRLPACIRDTSLA